MVVLLILGSRMFAQAVAYDPDRWCTGWHNPNNFTYTGGDANTQWQGLTGSKASTASSCTSGIPLVNNNPTVVSASNLTTISSGSSCYRWVL